MEAVWPFIGRDLELQRLGALVAEGDHRGAVVAGDAGVGKTRLAVECLRSARAAGLATLRATATRSASSLPFGAFSGLLKLNATGRGIVLDRTDLLRRYAADLVEQAAGRRLVVLVDDAHLLDDASATLVHQLAATHAAFVLLTVRTGEPAPDPVLALWKDSLAERVELGVLAPPTLVELLSTVLGGSIDEATALQLAERSEGNVMFLRELVVGALEGGALTNDDGLWRLTGVLSPSNRLVELVETRLEGVSLAERALLELAAVGEPLGEGELAALADPALAESLERRGLLTSRMNGRRIEIRLGHPVYGDVLRARMPALRRRAIARALAEVVEAHGARRHDDALRVASWRLVGGGGEAALLLAGATRARWTYEFPLAEQLARAAVDAGAGFEAALLAAQLASLQGRTDEAERELAALAPQAADDRQRGTVAIARIHNSVTWTGQDAHRIIDQAEAGISDPVWRTRLQAERLVFVDITRGPRATVDSALPLLDRAEADAEALAVACIPAAYGLARLGRLEAALATAERGHAAHLEAREPLGWYPWWHTATKCRALQSLGRFEEAEAMAASHYRRALSERSQEAQAIFALVPAFAVLERGRAQTSARRAREALAICQGLDRPVLVRLCHVYGAWAFALAGRPDYAEEMLSELEALPIPSVLHDVDLVRTWAWCAIAAGDLSEGQRHLKQAVALGDEIGDLVGAFAALHSLARLGCATEVAGRVTEIAGKIEGPLVTARVAHTHALADRDPARLEAVTRDFEALGADLLAAEAAADAAVHRRRRGERRAAAADEQLAHSLADRCENPVTPSLQAVEARAQLTASERETALLAAAGLSNRAIAARQFLSVRTVENRLQRVYEKLGISRRTDLVGALESRSEA